MDWFINLTPIEPTPILSASGAMHAIGKGNLKITFESEGRIISWLLKDTLYILECKITLIPIVAMSNIHWCVLSYMNLTYQKQQLSMVKDQKLPQYPKSVINC